MKLQFKPGVTGITGKNGTGKSSIIEGILFAFTGKLFTGDKAQAIKLGFDTGSVKLEFTLDGKHGSLERHLDVSSTKLTYDGKVYKKATEVKNLWDEMLQINTEIVERVIIAQQGQIKLLFSGDQTVREKIFQKIFLVPNTEKIRSVLFKNYIKTCPPIIPLEDIDMLWTNNARVKKELTEINLQIQEVSVYDETDLRAYQERLKFVRSCIAEEGKRISLTEAKEKVQAELEIVKENQQALFDAISGYDLKELELRREHILAIKAQLSSRQKLQKNLDRLILPFTVEELKVKEEELTQLEQVVHDMGIQILELNVKSGVVVKQLNHLATLHGEANCKTCGQSLQSSEKLIAELNKEKAAYAAELKELKDDHITGSRLLEGLQQELENYRLISQQQKQVKSMLATFTQEEFDQVELEELEEAIANFKDNKSALISLRATEQQHLSKIELFDMQLSKIPVYDGDGSPEEEINGLTEMIARIIEDLRILQEKKVILQVKTMELANIKERLTINLANKEKNVKRNKYMETLNKVYDSFHPSAFPRKLILDYAETVSDYLNEKLSDFNIPYKARVADNFKIIMLDADDRPLPTVSGGQEILVGLGLHLALHELFSQSFPLMIIDEGTTHLDEENVASYFDVIRHLKAGATHKQIIIIDHHSDLSQVVDQTIRLK